MSHVDALPVPLTSHTVGEVRRTLTALHFAKESLPEKERTLLYLAEGLMRVIDEHVPAVEASDAPQGDAARR